MDEMNKKVIGYIQKQKSPQKEILRRMRKIILKTFPKIKEEMRFGVPCPAQLLPVKGLPPATLCVAMRAGAASTYRRVVYGTALSSGAG